MVLTIILVVLRGTAAHAIDEDHEDYHAGIEDEKAPPMLLYISKEARLTGVTVVAQRILLVAPCLAVAVLHGGPQVGDSPVGRILEVKPALNRRLAAARLETKEQCV